MDGGPSFGGVVKMFLSEAVKIKRKRPYSMTQIGLFRPYKFERPLSHISNTSNISNTSSISLVSHVYHISLVFHLSHTSHLLNVSSTSNMSNIQYESTIFSGEGGAVFVVIFASASAKTKICKNK